MKTENIGRKLNGEWNVNAEHALYSKTGRTYDQLRRFPGALFDADGYIVFKTKQQYKQCRYLNINKKVSVPGGIRQIPNYTKRPVTSGNESRTLHSYLLTWNPKRWPWNINSDLAKLKKHGHCDTQWSCGNTRRIKPGDRIYLLKQGEEPRGIVASGIVQRGVFEEGHWEKGNKSKTALYVMVRFDALVDSKSVLPLSQLRNGKLKTVNWKTQSSGISIPPSAAAELENVWIEYLRQQGQSPAKLPDEVVAPDRYFEGAVRTIIVNAYERDPRAREDCIRHYGCKCSVCAFDFAIAYGSLGEKFIHVHHLVPLSMVGKEYVIDPVRDLRPVCPNCHAMLHRKSEVLKVEQLQKIVRSAHLTVYREVGNPT